jgi:hypothetical protein
MRKAAMWLAAGAVLATASWGWTEPPPDEAHGIGIEAGPAEQAEAPAVPAAWEGIARAPRGRVTDVLVALYRGDALDGEGRVADQSGSAVGPDLEIRAVSVPAVRVAAGALAFGPPAERPVPGAFSRGPARALIRALAQRGAFTIEVTGDREWAGALRLVAIYAEALEPRQVARNFSAGVEDAE